MLNKCLILCIINLELNILCKFYILLYNVKINLSLFNKNLYYLE